MICPNCKNQILDGNLYCETCGEEINFVPEFEPELENKMNETLIQVAEEINTPIRDYESEAFEKELSNFMEDEKLVSKFVVRFLKAKLPWILGFILILVLCMVGIWFYSLKLHTESYDYQYGQALINAQQGDYKKAITYMENAILINHDNDIAKKTLAEYYYEISDYNTAIVLLKELIDKESYLEDSYTLLIKIYSKKQEYDTISHLLLTCKNQEIQDLFSKYIAYSPVFSYGSGTYENVVVLKLSSKNQGTIYYTLDGTTPTTSSKQYDSPLFLENGVYRVSAMTVNKYGVESEIITNLYTIDTTIPYPPEVKIYSGNFVKPQLIAVEIPINGDVFYSIDGSDPTINGIHYLYPFPMPLGKNTLKFVTINYQGVSSEIVERSIQLDMQGEISPADAVNNLVMELTMRGYLLDYNGYVENLPGRNAYLISSGITVDNMEYYLIYENYEDIDGSMTETGNIFAVDIHSSIFYKYELKANGTFYLTLF